MDGVSVGWILSNGMELDGLKIIHTPGHSPGHICLAVGDVLLSADHVLSQTIPQQWPESIAAYTGLGHYLESLDKVQRMPGFALALAAHEQVIHELYRRIDTIRLAHVRRLDRLLETLRKFRRPLSVYETAKHLYPEVSGFPCDAGHHRRGIARGVSAPARPVEGRQSRRVRTPIQSRVPILRCLSERVAPHGRTKTRHNSEG